MKERMTRGLERLVIDEQRHRLRVALMQLEAEPLHDAKIVEADRLIMRVRGELQAVRASRQARNVARRRGNR